MKNNRKFVLKYNNSKKVNKSLLIEYFAKKYANELLLNMNKK